MGSSSQETNQTQHQTSQLTPWEPAQKGLESVIGKAENFLNKPPEYYPGQTFLNLNKNQINGLTDIRRGANNMQGSIVNPAVAAYQSLLGGPNQDPFDSALKYYSSRANETLNNTTLTGLNDISIANGDRSGSRAGVAEGLARASAGRDILGYNNDLAMNFEGLKQSGQEFALGQASNMGNLLLQPGNAKFDAATALRADSQNKLNENISRFNFNQSAPRADLQGWASLFGNYGAQFGTNTGDSESTSTKKSTPSAFSQIAGAAMAAYGIANPAFGAAMAASGGFGGMGGGGGGENIGMVPGNGANAISVTPNYFNTGLQNDPLNYGGYRP